MITNKRKWHVDELKFIEEKKVINEKFFINNDEVVNETSVKRIWHAFNAIMWTLKIKFLKEKTVVMLQR